MYRALPHSFQLVTPCFGVRLWELKKRWIDRCRLLFLSRDSLSLSPATLNCSLEANQWLHSRRWILLKILNGFLTKPSKLLERPVVAIEGPPAAKQAFCGGAVDV